MKKTAFLMVLLSLVTSTSFALGEYNSKDNCVITLDKVASENQKLVIACDGQAILNVKIVSYEQGIEKNLYSTFLTMVNTDGAKHCEQYNQENVWWASCLRK